MKSGTVGAINFAVTKEFGKLRGLARISRSHFPTCTSYPIIIQFINVQLLVILMAYLSRKLSTWLLFLLNEAGTLLSLGSWLFSEVSLHLTLQAPVFPCVLLVHRQSHFSFPMHDPICPGPRQDGTSVSRIVCVRRAYVESSPLREAVWPPEV